MNPRPPILEPIRAQVAALRESLAIAAQQIDGATAPDLAAGFAELDDGCARFQRDVAAHNFTVGRHD